MGGPPKTGKGGLPGKTLKKGLDLASLTLLHFDLPFLPAAQTQKEEDAAQSCDQHVM